jgi:cytochrome b6-f complex iron-sulfur subunit
VEGVTRMQAAVVVLAIVFAALAVALMIVSLRQSRRVPVTTVPTTGDAEPSPVDRRRFLNRTMLGSLALFSIAMGAGSTAFLWPKVKRGFGSKIVAGKRGQLLADIDREGRPVYNVDGRFYLVRYEGNDPDYYLRAGVLAGGLMAVFQRCSHLGCRVPYCPTSGWFECPCHDAWFNGAGEYVRGVAPAGLWHFPIEINSNDEVVVDTSRRRAQTPRGFTTMPEAPAGANCVS